MTSQSSRGTSRPDREELLILQEGVKQIQVTVSELKSTLRDFQKEVRLELGKTRDQLETGYMSRSEFELRVKPLERLVYGMVGLILIAVMTALIAIVVVR